MHRRASLVKRQDPLKRRGALGERGQRIDFRERTGAVLQRPEHVTQLRQHRLVQRPLARQRRVARARSTRSSKLLASAVMKRSADFTVWRRM